MQQDLTKPNNNYAAQNGRIIASPLPHRTANPNQTNIYPTQLRPFHLMI
jgi:hypothetical protein